MSEPLIMEFGQEPAVYARGDNVLTDVRTHLAQCKMSTIRVV